MIQYTLSLSHTQTHTSKHTLHIGKNRKSYRARIALVEWNKDLLAYSVQEVCQSNLYQYEIKRNNYSVLLCLLCFVVSFIHYLSALSHWPFIRLRFTGLFFTRTYYMCVKVCIHVHGIGSQRCTAHTHTQQLVEIFNFTIRICLPLKANSFNRNQSIFISLVRSPFRLHPSIRLLYIFTVQTKIELNT